MSMAAVLEQNVATPHTHVVVPNRLHRGDRLFKDDIDHPTWYLTLNGVLAKSSNIGTILATGQLGKTQRQANQVLYRICASSASAATPGSASPARQGHPRGARRLVDLAAVHDSFRPGCVPQRDAGGLRLLDHRQWRRTYRTLDRARHEGAGRTLHARREAQGDKGRQRRTAKTLARMLESVVDDEEGTGTKARIPGYRVAGKTGTANRVDPATGKYKGYTSSFAGFAPADKPRVTVYCAIQNATKGDYFGGQICGPVYSQVMEFALKSLQVPPTGAKAASFPVTYKP